MDCKTAQGMISRYIDNTLSDRELSAFLDHIDSCPECYDELEIVHTIVTGIKRLDDDNASYDLRGLMKKSLTESRSYVKKLQFLKTAKYVFTTLAIYGVAAALFLQFRIWFIG